MGNVKINFKTSKLEIESGANIFALSRKKIEQLNSDSFFKYQSTNFYGRYLTHYLFNMSLYDLGNSEPLNPEKNTYPKIMNWLKIVDSAIDKPLEKVSRIDLENFIQNFMAGKIESRNPNRPNVARSVRFYVQNYQRLLKVMIEYREQNKSVFDYTQYRWVDKIQTPRNKKQEYEKFPHLSIKQILDFVNEFSFDEYKIRILISVNLLGRSCEISELRFKDIEKKEDGSLWIQLPEVKSHSFEKVPIELWLFVRKEFDNFLKKYNFQPDDKIFSRGSEAFAKQLKQTSEKWIREQKITSKITPKSFRKIGLGIAEELGYSRADCERLGGWASNSPVLNHYFSRKAVSASDKSQEVSKTLENDIYTELEKEKNRNKQIEGEISEIKSVMKKLLLKNLSDEKQRIELTIPKLPDGVREKLEKNLEINEKLKKGWKEIL